MDARLLHRLTHPVAYVPVTDTDKYGKPVLGTIVPLMAYRHGVRDRVLAFDGTEIVSERRYIVDGMYEAQDGDFLRINTVDVPIKAVSVFDGLVPGTGTTVFYV